MRADTQTHTHTYAHAHIHIHTHTHARMHARTHTRTHMHTNASLSSCMTSNRSSVTHWCALVPAHVPRLFQHARSLFPQRSHKGIPRNQTSCPNILGCTCSRVKLSGLGFRV